MVIFSSVMPRIFKLLLIFSRAALARTLARSSFDLNLLVGTVDALAFKFNTIFCPAFLILTNESINCLYCGALSSTSFMLYLKWKVKQPSLNDMLSGVSEVLVM